MQTRQRYKDIITGQNGQMISKSSHLYSWRDAYHALLTIRWPFFFLGFIMTFWGINAIFGWLYYLSGGIGGREQVTFGDCFFFSVQTLSTVGYGHLHPLNLTANILVACEILLGLILISTLTGLIFARFSRPKARMLFSSVAVVHNRDGLPTLSFRVANERNTHIAEARAQAFLLRDTLTAEGHRMRRFFDLKLVRNQTPALLLSWTVMHVIDAESPLASVTREEFEAGAMVIMISLTGYDSALAQTTQTNHAYGPGAVLWNHEFEDAIERHDTHTRLYYERISSVKAVDETASAAIKTGS